MNKVVLYADRQGGFFSKCGWTATYDPNADVNQAWTFKHPDGTVFEPTQSYYGFEYPDTEFEFRRRHWVKFGPQHFPAGSIIEVKSWDGTTTKEVVSVYKTSQGHRWLVVTTDGVQHDVESIVRVIKRGQGGLHYEPSHDAANSNSFLCPTHEELQALRRQLDREEDPRQYLATLTTYLNWLLIEDYPSDGPYPYFNLRQFIVKHCEPFNAFMWSTQNFKPLTKPQLKRLQRAVNKNRNRLSCALHWSKY